MNIQSRPYEKDGVIDKDKIEDAIRLAAGYFDSTLRTGIPVRFLCNAGPLHSREAVVTEEYHGREHVNELMRRLAALPLSSTENFPTFLGTTCRDINSSDIVILTCYANADIFAYATQKQAMGSSVRLIHIGSLPDTVTPPDDLPSLLIGRRDRMAHRNHNRVSKPENPKAASSQRLIKIVRAMTVFGYLAGFYRFSYWRLPTAWNRMGRCLARSC